ncbi:rhodanese-like domain-containing protein [Pseudoalteromonas obscura]|uniref:Rhodanese-like domain-containing protein n=1 Tax=Pseudoalteromonas obscura TaxID=3048491 RepID=A0ABT7EUC1_9GAMM|nr:rhodanese-like domain-containing protein [Pseudoalteromonas sp. P94(2023)]MDK2598589.1 rhodanese-like domain-containing protein [Pseudoalteromonas sp. P94(2023)]
MFQPTKDLVASVRAKQNCVDGKQAKQELAVNQGFLIDVREASEYQTGAPKAAIHISRGLLEFKLPVLAPDLKTAIYLYCASGGRAVLAAEQLKRLGYQNITVLTSSPTELCTIFPS